LFADPHFHRIHRIQIDLGHENRELESSPANVNTPPDTKSFRFACG
jgi:hypothetical protein